MLTMVIMAMEDMVLVTMVMDMPAVMLAVLSMATLDMVDMEMVLDMDTDMDMAISARDLLSHMVLLFMAMLWELLDTLVMPKAMSAQLSMVTQEAFFLARGQLILNLLLKLILMLTMDILMESMDILMADTDITMARGLLMPILRQLLMLMPLLLQSLDMVMVTLWTWIWSLY